MKKKLFGNKIIVDCSYCNNSFIQNYCLECAKSKQIKNGKCRSFSYDPLLREPRSVTLSGNYTADDFKL